MHRGHWQSSWAPFFALEAWGLEGYRLGRDVQSWARHQQEGRNSFWHHSHQPQNMLTEEMALHPMPHSQNQLGEDHTIAKKRLEPAFEHGKPCFELLGKSLEAYQRRAHCLAPGAVPKGP